MTIQEYKKNKTEDSSQQGSQRQTIQDYKREKQTAQAMPAQEETREPIDLYTPSLNPRQTFQTQMASAGQAMQEERQRKEELRALNPRLTFPDQLAMADYNIQKQLEEKLKQYSDIPKAADYAEKSQYVPTGSGEQKVNLIASLLNNNNGLVYEDTGYGDLLYEYINGNEEAGSMLRQKAAQDWGGDSALGALYGMATQSDEQSQRMTEDEIGTFNYIYATQGKDAAYDYYASIEKELNRRNREFDERQARIEAGQHPFAASVATIFTKPLASLSYLNQVADYAMTGQIDQNAPANRFSYMNTAMRAEVASNIEKHWGKAGSWAYQLGMSMADSMMNMLPTLATGGADAAVSNFMLAVMGTEAAADTVIDMKDRGFDDDKVFTLGTIAGIAEFLTERIGMDAFVEAAMGSMSADTFKKYLGKALLKNIGAEGTEEGLSDLINWSADAIYASITDNSSEFQEMISAYQAKGLSERDAFLAAYKDRLKEIGLDVLGGAISGGMFGIAGTGLNYAGQTFAQMNNNRSSQTPAKAAPTLEDVQNALSSAGASSDQVATLAPILNDVLSGIEISGNKASKIAQNEAAISVLQQMTGAEINTDAPISDVKAAIKAFANPVDASNGGQSYNLSSEDKNTQNGEIRTLGKADVESFANALDKNARETFINQFQEGQNAADYIQDMWAAYNLGRVGGEYQPTRASSLTNDQLYAAYYAGTQDADASVRSRAEARQQKIKGKTNVPISVEGSDDAYNYMVEHYDQKTADKLIQLADRLGLNVAFVDSVAGGNANAEIYGADVLVEKGNKNPIQFLLGHEFTHRLQDLAPEQYYAFRDAIADDEMVQADIMSTRLAYKNRLGKDISYEDALDEAAANYAGRLMQDEAFLDSFIKQHKEEKTLLQKIRDAIRSFIDKLVGKEKTNAQIAVEKLNEALGEAEAQVKENLKAQLAEEATSEAEDSARIAKENEAVGDNSAEAAPFKFSIKGGESVMIPTGTFFSGAGTVNYALSAVISSRMDVEYDGAIANVFRLNNGDILVDDVRNVDVAKLGEGVEYFHASPVCKHYSQMDRNRSSRADDETDMTTARATADAIRKMHPKVFTLEQVPGYDGSQALKTITDALDELGYTYDTGIFNAYDYGGATSRKRLLLRAVSEGELPALPEKVKGKTWYEATKDMIDDLPDFHVQDFLQERLDRTEGIDYTKPVLVLGGTNGGLAWFANADQPCPSPTTSIDSSVILMPNGDVKRATPSFYAEIFGLHDFKLNQVKDNRVSQETAYKVVANGVPAELTQKIFGNLLSDQFGTRRYSLKTLTAEELSKQLGMPIKDVAPAAAALKDIDGIQLEIDFDKLIGKKEIETIFDGFKRDLIYKGGISLIGKKFNNVHELAVASTIFRDPRFETFRYVFTNKDGKVVLNTGVSSRIPNSSSAYLKDAGVWRANLFNKAVSLGAENVYFMHNHPSGDPNPSPEDIKLTSALVKYVEIGSIKYGGHIVLDHNAYTVIDRYGAYLTYALPSDKASSSPINNKGPMLLSPEALRDIADTINAEENDIVLIFTNAKGRVSGIQKIVGDYFENYAKFKEYLHDEGLNFGAVSIFAYLNKPSAETLDIFNEAYGRNLIMDVVCAKGDSWAKVGLRRYANDKLNGYMGTPHTAQERFSLKAPVEETDRLMAWHNMSIEALDSAADLGGLAMPSFAVKPSDLPHTKYGPVSVMAYKDSIAPKGQSQMIFGGDAWTPTFPRIGYKISDEAWDIQKEIGSILKNIGARNDEYFNDWEAENIQDALERYSGNFVEAYKKNDNLRLAYATQMGRNIDIPRKVKNFSRDADNETLDKIYNAFSAYLEETGREGESYDTTTPFEPRLRQIMREYYDKRFPALTDKVYPADEALTYNETDRLVHDANRYGDAARRNKLEEVDWSKLWAVLRDTYDNDPELQAGFEKWLEDYGKRLVVARGVRNNRDLFTPSGSRRGFDQLYMAYSLENIVRAMQAQPKQGRTQFLSGAAAVKGAALKSYKSIEDARKEVGRLRHEEDSEAVLQSYKKFSEHVGELAMKVNSDIFRGSEDLAEILSVAKTKDAIYRYLKREFTGFIDVTEDLAQEIYELGQEANTLPMEYLESKLYRAFPFSEAAAIVVPSDTPQKTIDKLNNLGANVLTYEAGDNDDRVAKVNSVEGVRFSLKPDARKALDYFGKTNNWNETGYLLTDGTRLDFSGKKFGARGGYRALDHRDISKALGDDYGIEDLVSGPTIQFMREGNIRIMPEANGISLIVEPTTAQYIFLESFINKCLGEVTVDIDGPNGDTIESFEYDEGTKASTILRDIEQYFKTGKTAQSDLMRFHERFSIKDTDDQGRKLSAQQREYFKDSKAVDQNGNLLTLYHGTRKGGFTVFKDWSYLTPDEQYAQRYADKDTGETMYEVYANVLKPFDTRLPECREIFENEYMGNYSNTPLQDTGLPDWTDGYDLVDFIEDNGYDYDAVLLDEGADQINGDVVERGISYVIRSSEQIKSVDNKTPTSNEDIRYSLKGTESTKSMVELAQENKQLNTKLRQVERALKAARESKEKLKGQMKVTTTPRVREDDILKLAKAEIRSMKSKADAKTVAAILQKAGDYIVSDGDGEGLSYDAIKDMLYEAGREIVENAEELVNDQDYETQQQIKKFFKSSKFYFDNYEHFDQTAPGWERNWDEYRKRHGEIADYQDLRKHNFGRFTLTKDHSARAIDDAWKEAQEMFGTEYFPEDITAIPDMIYHISDLLDTFQPEYANPYEYELAEVIEYETNELMDAILSEAVRQQAPTYADKVKRALEKQRYDYQEKLSEIRRQRDEAVEKVKQGYRESRQRQAERREDASARTRLLKIARRLANKKLPAATRDLIKEYIGDLDLIAKSMTGATKQKLSDLQDWYLDQKENNPDFVADPAIEKSLQRLSKKQIKDLSSEEVADLTDILLNIENEIRTQKKFIESKIRKETYQAGRETINNIRNARGGKGGFMDKLVVSQLLSPIREVRRITGYVDDDPLVMSMEELADGQRKMYDYQMRAKRKFDKWVWDKAFTKSFAGKDAKEIEIGFVQGDHGGKVKITPAMRASLYLHSLNPQNMRHIVNGGITIPDMKLYKQGKMQEAYDEGQTIRLTPSQIRTICADMTPEERAFARAAHNYFNGQSRDEINATSEALKGYSLANVENYFPIDTDKSFLRQEFDSIKRDGTIEGMGFLKERVNASNPIMLYDMQSVLNKSIDAHAKYVGLAIPVRNFGKLWGVSTGTFGEDKKFIYNDSVQKAVKNKWGQQAYDYIEHLMSDLNNPALDKDAWGELLAKARGAFARATLELNIGVALKQAASYPSAAAVVGFKPLNQALADTRKVDLDLIMKYTPLLYRRSQGFSNQELGELAKRGKVLPKGLNWIQLVDIATTTKLWKAAEYYVRDYNKDLAVGTQNYYEAVADVYNRIIEETQPNYTALQRPALLRSRNELVRTLNMFKTQPFQNFNVLYDAVANMRAKKAKYVVSGSKESKDAYIAARQQAVRAVGSQVAAALVFALTQFIWDAIRGKTKPYKDKDEDEMTLESWGKRMGFNILGNSAGMLPFGGELLNAFEAGTDKVLKKLEKDPIFDATYYGIDVSAVAAIDDTIEDTISAVASAVDKGATLETRARAIYKAASDYAKMMGIPVENVKNGVVAMVQNGLKATMDKYVGEYYALRIVSDPAKYPSDYYDLLWKTRKKNDPAYKEIYELMVKDSSGVFTDDKIKTNMENRMKKEQGVASVKDLSERYMSPNQQSDYDSSLSRVSRDSMWRKASSEQRSSIEDMIYEMSVDSADGKKIRETIESGSQYGLSETEYLLYQLALEMVDKPNDHGKMGTYTQDEVEEAIRKIKGLSDEERSYLWRAAGKSEKSDPFK